LTYDLTPSKDLHSESSPNKKSSDEDISTLQSLSGVTSPGSSVEPSSVTSPGSSVEPSSVTSPGSSVEPSSVTSPGSSVEPSSVTCGLLLIIYTNHCNYVTEIKR